MATIVENISGDKALQLGNEEFVRKLGYGTNWTKLRVGCRMWVNGSTDVVTPRFQMGLCVGDVNTFASASCIQYVGSTTNTAGNMTYNGALLSYAWQASSNSPYVTKVGASTTYNIVGGAGHPPGNYAAAGSGRTVIVLTQFTKLTATTLLISTTYTSDAAYANVPVTYHLLRSLDDEVGTSAFSATYFTYLTARTVSGMSNVVDLNTVSIYWSHSTPTVEVHDIVAVRFY